MDPEKELEQVQGIMCSIEGCVKPDRTSKDLAEEIKRSTLNPILEKPVNDQGESQTH